MPEEKDPDIIGHSVAEMKCENCGHAIDTTHTAPFDEVQCPQCQEKQSVPAQLGSFRLEDKLGSGGMGTVYRAFDESLGRYVALKVTHHALSEDRKFVDSFLREARAAAAPNHPNIAQVYSFGEEDGRPYIVMEFLDGGKLDDVMSSGKPLDEQLVLDIGLGVAEGLRAANAKGIIHGDVKPANILFGQNQMAKVVDFGLARFINEHQQPGEIWGTPYYIAPEKVRRQKVDCRSDIYSLGATLYHALVGAPPFDGKTALKVVQARLLYPPKDLAEQRPGIHPETARVVRRMLEADPSDRYPTYDSLISDLRRTLDVIKKERSKSHFNMSESARRQIVGLSVAIAVFLVVAVIGSVLRGKAKKRAQIRAEQQRELQEKLALQEQLRLAEELKQQKKKREEDRLKALAAENVQRETALAAIAQKKKAEQARKDAAEKALRDAEARKVEKAHRDAEARKAKLALVQKTKAELAELDKTAVHNNALVKHYAFDEAANRLGKLAGGLQTREAKARARVLEQRYQYLIDLKTFLVRSINSKPFRYGWVRPGSSARDITGADKRGIQLGNRTVPWKIVSLGQFVRIVKNYLKIANFSQLAHMANVQIGVAVLLYEHELPSSAQEFVDKAVHLYPKIKAASKDVLADLATAAAANVHDTDRAGRPLPFAENFEARSPGSIQGKNAWVASSTGTAHVQDTIVHSGRHALRIARLGSAIQFFDVGDTSTVWIDMHVKLEPYPSKRNPVISPSSTTAFFVNPHGYFVVYDGRKKGKWKTLQQRTQPGKWVRLTIQQDYKKQQWTLYVDGKEAAKGLGFATKKTAFTAFSISGGMQNTYLDDLSITAKPPRDIR